jgi:methyltransferase (TIGR00027 family)
VAEGERGASRTAILTAAARALHRDESPPWVLDDPFAGPLAGEDGIVIGEQLRAALPPEQLLSFTRWICVRARYVEDLVERAVTSGTATQYVILGAGLDSFAYRRTAGLERLRVFEVDHPASQAWKRARLTAIGVTPPDDLVFAPVDFEHQTLAEGLALASFAWDAATIVSWIGVTMYLTGDAIDATLRAVAGFAHGSRLVLTYNQPPSALAGFGGRIEAVMSGITTTMGEPFVSLYEPQQIEQLLRDHGYTDIEHFGPDEARATYLPGRDDVHFGGAQRLIAANVPTRSRTWDV